MRAGGDRTLILILPKKKQIYALSTAALRQAQASRRQLANDYRDALILDRDGTVRRIEQIEVEGPWGETFGRKLLSRLTDGWRIAVPLSQPLTWRFEEVKQLIAECIIADVDPVFPVLEEASSRREIVRSILAAESAEQIFDILKTPPPEDALDVL